MGTGGEAQKRYSGEKGMSTGSFIAYWELGLLSVEVRMVTQPREQSRMNIETQHRGLDTSGAPVFSHVQSLLDQHEQAIILACGEARSLAIEQHAALTVCEQEQRVQRVIVHAMPEHRVAQQHQVRVPGLRDRHVR
jgi:hypothetical protein